MHGKRRVDTRQSSDEVVLEGGNGAFRGVVAMEMRGDQLEFYFVFVEVNLKRLRAFIIQDLDVWLETTIGKIIMHFCRDSYHFLLRPILHCLGEDCIYVLDK